MRCDILRVQFSYERLLVISETPQMKPIRGASGCSYPFVAANVKHRVLYRFDTRFDFDTQRIAAVSSDHRKHVEPAQVRLDGLPERLFTSPSSLTLHGKPLAGSSNLRANSVRRASC